MRNAAGIRNLARILIGRSLEEDLGNRQAVVVSAMGKTTNALEAVWKALPHATSIETVLGTVVQDHALCAAELGLPSDVLEADFAAFRVMAESWKGKALCDEGYDALVGFGERWSTRLVAAHLVQEGVPATWCSAWELVHTDGRHRSPVVNVTATGEAILQAAKTWSIEGCVPVMQGFVGRGPQGEPVTLGREGSDFSGALLAEALSARSFLVWKDVPGVMTGDPRWWPTATFIPHLDHGTAEAMGKAGAGILHPNTVAPLRRKGIPLEVKSFVDPKARGTRVEGHVPPDGLPGLWSMEPGTGPRRTVRCIGLDPEAAQAEWNQVFPHHPVFAARVDEGIPNCAMLEVQHGQTQPKQEQETGAKKNAGSWPA